MGFLDNVKAHIKDEFAFKKEVRDIEKAEYRKAKKTEAKTFAQKKAKLEAKQKLDKLKGTKKSDGKGFFDVKPVLVDKTEGQFASKRSGKSKEYPIPEPFEPPRLINDPNPEFFKPPRPNTKQVRRL